MLVVPDHKLGTNDCRGWLRRSLFAKLKQKHDAEVVADHVERLRREKIGRALEKEFSDGDCTQLEEIAKREIAHKFLPSGRFYQFRMAFANTQAKGSFKWMGDDVADALKADCVLPESAIKPGLKGPAVVYSVIGEGRRFRSRSDGYSRSVTPTRIRILVHTAGTRTNGLDSMGVLPQAMKQVAKLSEAVGQGRYDELLVILGHHPDKIRLRLPSRTVAKSSVLLRDYCWPMRAAKSFAILTSTINLTRSWHAGRSRQRLAEVFVYQLLH